MPTVLLLDVSISLARPVHGSDKTRKDLVQRGNLFSLVLIYWDECLSTFESLVEAHDTDCRKCFVVFCRRFIAQWHTYTRRVALSSVLGNEPSAGTDLRHHLLVGWQSRGSVHERPRTAESIDPRTQVTGKLAGDRMEVISSGWFGQHMNIKDKTALDVGLLAVLSYATHALGSSPSSLQIVLITDGRFDVLSVLLSIELSCNVVDNRPNGKGDPLSVVFPFAIKLHAIAFGHANELNINQLKTLSSR